LLLCFENISKNNHSILGKSTQFNIKYPNQPEPVRKWDISIPTLDSPGDIRIEHSRAFFTPEICGSHELRIKGLPGLRYAGPYGVGGRRYRISSPSGDWLLYFHVSSSYEYKVFIIAFVALAVAILSIFVSILGSV
jgi:hypothetical protein